MKYYTQHEHVNVPEGGFFERVSVPGGVREAMGLKTELIDISYAEYIELKNEITIESVSVFQVGYADALQLVGDKYQFVSLNQKSFLKLLTDSHDHLRTDLWAVVVGSAETFLSFIPVLAQVGFKKFLVAVENTEYCQPLIDKMMKIYLGLNIELISYTQVNQIESISSFLLTDFDHIQYKEISQALSYFNFLAPQSLFFDLQSVNNQELQEEALRAHLHCILANDFFKNRLEMAEEFSI